MDGFNVRMSESSMLIEQKISEDRRPAENRVDHTAVQHQAIEKASTESSLIEFSFNYQNYSKEQIRDYLEKHQADELEKKLEFIQKELVSDPGADLSKLRKLHSVEGDDKKSRKLRQILDDIERTKDLEELLFGDGRGSSATSRKILEDLESQSQSMSMDLKFHLSFNLEAKASSQSAASADEDLFVDLRGRQFVSRREADPLIFDLGGNGIQSTGIKDGIRFDIDGDGQVEQTSFVSGDDFALALDKNDNGFIDSGKELFGDQSGSLDGIEELTRYDDNSDGKIDAADSIYNDLRFVNSNRRSMTLEEAGVEEIDLARKDIKGFTNQGDRYDGALNFKTIDGRTHEARDLFFQYRSLK